MAEDEQTSKFTERKKWLEYQGFATEIKNISDQIHFIGNLIIDIQNAGKFDETTAEGINGMLGLIASKLSDMAGGRLPYDLLPHTCEE